MSDYAISLENVSKTFQLNKGQSVFEKLRDKQQNFKPPAKLIVLDHLTFKVSKGETLAIIGLNGSGKTTLLRIISGIYQPDFGSVKINGKLGPLLHIGTGFQQELVAKDNITIYGLLLGMSKSEITEKIDHIIKFAELEKFSRMKLKHYSTGMRMRLAFSTILQTNPEIVLLDEALSVGDKSFREKSYEEFQSFKEKGKTIVIATHNQSKIEEFSDRVLLLHQGRIISIGEPSEVLKEYNELTKRKKFLNN